uniref:Arginine vasopressin-induced protein 1 n=1 Tax=Aquila chrysaetos chrysaetos TaxID=223781 RepID=A0A663DMQ2_AQUCH
MGTPASVVSDPPGRAVPAARGRKRASANIFQGVGLPELRSLFRSGGAERPEERARLVWRYAGQRRMARALRRLRRRRSPRQADAGSSPGTILDNTSPATSVLGRKGLAASPTHSRPAGLSAPGQPGTHAGPPMLPSRLPPMQQKSPSGPSPAPAAPCHSRGP